MGGRRCRRTFIFGTLNQLNLPQDPATSGFSFPYLLSKSAIGHATSTLAHELLPLGIRVNGIAPGKYSFYTIRRGTNFFLHLLGFFITEVSSKNRLSNP